MTLRRSVLDRPLNLWRPFYGGGPAFTAVDPAGYPELIIGTTRPIGGVNVGAGIIRSAPSITLAGDQSLASSSNVLDRIITGRARRTSGATSILVENSEIIGKAAADTYAWLADGSQSSGGGGVNDIIFRYCTIHPQAISTYINAGGSGNITFDRCWIYGSTDGLNPQGSGVINFLATGNHIEKLIYQKPDVATPSHTDGTHNDPIQIQSGTNITIDGNFIDGFLDPASPQYTQAPGYATGGQTNACIQFNQPLGSVGATIKRNWLRGGVESFNMFALTGSGHSVNIFDNRFMSGTTGNGIDIEKRASATGIIIGTNYTTDADWVITGTSIAVTTRSG